MDSGFTNGNNGMAAGVWTDVSGLDKKTEASRTYVVLYVEGLSASDSANDQQILFSLEPDDENIDAFPVAEVRVTVLDPVVSDALSGVVRTDGSVSFTSVAGGLDGMLPWSPQLTYSTQLGVYSGRVGNNFWFGAELFEAGASTIVVRGGTIEVFDQVKNDSGTGTHFVGRMGTLDRLDGSTLYLASGGSITFAPNGTFASATDSGGNAIYMAPWDPNGNWPQYAASGKDYLETVQAIYKKTDDGLSLLDRVIVRRQAVIGSTPVTADDAVILEEIQYEYYEAGDLNGNLYGNLHDLKRVKTYDGNGRLQDVSYYRYVDQGTAGDSLDTKKPSQISMIFSTSGYLRMAHDLGSSVPIDDFDVWNFGETVIGEYADYILIYGDHGVESQTIQGSGSGTLTGDTSATYNYSYGDMFTDIGVNVVARGVTETSPSGATTSFYMNHAGQVMGTETTADSKTYYGWTWYDNRGRAQYTADANAVQTFNMQCQDLVSSQGGGQWSYIRDAQGVLTSYDYGTSTSGGDVAGYLKSITIRHGDANANESPFVAEEFKYTPVGSIYMVNEDTVHNTVPTGTPVDSAGSMTTTITYPAQNVVGNLPTKVVTALPSISNQGGRPGANGTTNVTAITDNRGRLLTGTDADGHVAKATPDPVTGSTKSSSINGTNVSGTVLKQDDYGRPLKSVSGGYYTYYDYKDNQTDSNGGLYSEVDTWGDTGPRAGVRTNYSLGVTDSFTYEGSTVLSLTRGWTDRGGRLRQVDEYYSFSTTSYDSLYNSIYSGASGGGYFYQTSYGFDGNGNLNEVVNPVGTVTWTTFNSLGQPTAVSQNLDPNSSSGAVQLASFGYGGGLGLLTTMTQYLGSCSTLVTEYFHDWQGRLVATTQAGSSPSGNMQGPVQYSFLDALGRVSMAETWAGGASLTRCLEEGGTATSVPSASAHTVLSRSTFQYDNRGQVYSERDATFALAYNTDGTPKSAAPGQKDSKPTNYWHDNEGNVVCASTPGQASQKYEYDAANRVKVAYVTDNAGGNPFSVAGDHILEQTEFQYNGAGQVLFTISRQRQDDGSMRSSYVANWYDLGGRLVQTTDFGTNGGSAMSYPADRSSYSRTSTGHGTAFLTTTCNYPDAKTVIVTDPKGIQTLTESDALGRTIRRISDYTDGIVTASSNQTVTYEYDGLNHVIVQTQLLPSNGSRATTYDYAAQTDSFPSKDLLRETHIQNLDGSTTDIVMTYDHGRLATQTTSSGTGGYVMHTYGYDALGRQESDTATTTRTDVDMSIDKLTTGYDLFGRPNVFTSWDGDTIKNQVVREYGAWGQVTAEHQAHGWAVTDSSPVVKYGYTGLNLTSETYPLTGRVVGYTYGSAGSINSRIGRVAAVTDRLSGGTAATVESYTYLGLGAIVQRTQNSQQVTAVYGLDNFGRTNSLTWSYTGSSPATLEQVTYGYDADSNLLYENNVLHGSSSGLYKYDSLGRMSDFYRQAITFSGGQPVYPTTTATESYGLDASSQWTAYSQSGGTAVDLTESSNGTAVKQSLGDVVSADTSLLHATFKYDAWDRLVDAQTFEGTPGASTQTARETYSYDALGRMIVETVMSGTYFTYERFVHDRYYSAGWQVIEEQVTDRTQTVATIIIKDNVWSVAYKDAMIFQQVFSVSGQTVTPGAITYALQNANWDVTAIMASGAADVSARFVTDPYGAYTTLNADWSAIVSPDPTPLFDFHHQGLEQNQDQGAVALYYNCNRMYAFQIGQFLQTDPARQGLNWRAYQSSSPAGRTDQFGLDDRPWYQVIGAQFADGWSAVREAADYGTWTHEATSSHGQAALRGTAQVGASILIFPKDTFQKAAFDIQSCWGLICWWGGDASVLANTGNEAADRTVNEAVAFDKKINGLIANGNSLNAGGELGKQTAKQFPVANTVVSIYESLAENNWTWTYDTTQSGVRSAEGDAITLVSGKVLGKVGNARLTLTAVPGSPTGLTGPVVFRAPRSGATAAELRQIEAYTAGCNEAQRAGALSPTGRVSTRGTLERQGGMAAAAERARASATGSPYSGQAGHVPDTTWTGNPQPQSWLDLTRSVNSSLGAQARLYPIGYQPTKFIFSPPIMPYSPLYGNIFPFLMKPAFAPTSQPASGGY